MIGIVAATHWELAELRKRIWIENHVQMGARALWEGICRGRRVVLMQSGVGRARAEGAAALLLDRYPLSELLCVGFGGGVSEELRCGDVVVCPTVHLAQGGRVPAEWTLAGGVASDGSLQSLATGALNEEGIRAHLGDGLTVSRVIASSVLKSKIGRALPVKVVDMESFWVAHLALDRVRALLVVRAITDPLDYSLPDLAGVFDAEWNLRPKQVMLKMLRRPAYALDLMSLARRARKAAGSLGVFVPALVGRM